MLDGNYVYDIIDEKSSTTIPIRDLDAQEKLAEMPSTTTRGMVKVDGVTIFADANGVISTNGTPGPQPIAANQFGMTFTISTEDMAAGNDTIAYPIIEQDLAQNFTINWGDGNTDSFEYHTHISGYPKHTYTQAGTYQVVLTCLNDVEGAENTMPMFASTWQTIDSYENSSSADGTETVTLGSTDYYIPNAICGQSKTTSWDPSPSDSNYPFSYLSGYDNIFSKETSSPQLFVCRRSNTNDFQLNETLSDADINPSSSYSYVGNYNDGMSTYKYFIAIDKNYFVREIYDSTTGESKKIDFSNITLDLGSPSGSDPDITSVYKIWRLEREYNEQTYTTTYTIKEELQNISVTTPSSGTFSEPIYTFDMRSFRTDSPESMIADMLLIEVPSAYPYCWATYLKYVSRYNYLHDVLNNNHESLSYYYNSNGYVYPGSENTFSSSSSTDSYINFGSYNVIAYSTSQSGQSWGNSFGSNYGFKNLRLDLSNYSSGTLQIYRGRYGSGSGGGTSIYIPDESIDGVNGLIANIDLSTTDKYVIENYIDSYYLNGDDSNSYPYLIFYMNGTSSSQRSQYVSAYFESDAHPVNAQWRRFLTEVNSPLLQMVNYDSENQTNVDRASLSYLFVDCENLTTIPSTLFSNIGAHLIADGSGIDASLQGMFRNTGLTEWPEYLLKQEYFVGSNVYSLPEMFAHSQINSISNPLFEEEDNQFYNFSSFLSETQLTTLETIDGNNYFFDICDYSEINDYNNTKVVDFSSMFSYSNITSTNGIFNNFINTYGYSNGKDSSGAGSSSLFDHVKFNYTFSGCKNLCISSSDFPTSVGGGGYYSLNSAYDVFSYTYYRDSYNQAAEGGYAPDLWNMSYYESTSSNAPYSFAGNGNNSSTLSNYSDINQYWKSSSY